MPAAGLKLWHGAASTPARQAQTRPGASPTMKRGERIIRKLTLACLLLVMSACGGGGASPTSGATTSTGAGASPAATALGTPVPGTSAPAVLAFTACPPSAVTSGEPPPADNGPTGACEAAEILYPSSGQPCTPSSGKFVTSSNCPLYPDLAQRLDQQPLGGPGGGADSVCRCQNTWMSSTYQVEGPTPDGPTTWDVRVIIVFGPSSQESFDVIVQAVASGSLISDIQCGGGGASTSIKQASPGPCT
jgi:hypothetical protein